MRQAALALALALVLSACPAGRAEPGLPAALRDVGLDQRLDEQVPLDLEFRDEAGRAVTLGTCMKGKPAVLVLAYYRCPMLCTQVLNGLLEALRGVPFDVGEQFNVIAVSFDARETPELAAARKASYVEGYGRPGSARGWSFLTGGQESIDRLTQAVGFRYAYDARADQFAHASGVMLLTPTGRLARYFYGIAYAPRDLRLGLVEASAHRIGTPVDRVLLFCFHYDPAAGKYTAVVMNFVRLGGLLTVVGLGVMLWRVSRRARPAGAQG